MSVRENSENVIDIEREKLKPPPLYRVMVLNDDYTPMDFVVAVLQLVFSMTREQATQVMLRVHREGSGVCGVYTFEIAEAKVKQVLKFASEHQHPLQCVLDRA
jgi:ATP-dependent Clp protease adaptor protein ClpS